MPKVKTPEFLRQAAYARSIVEQKLTENMIKVPMAAKRLGISESGFYKKKRQPGLFKVEELARLAEMTSMTDEEIIAIVKGRRKTG